MILFYFLLNLSMAGGNQDHLVGPILCFTLRDQSYISKVPDPQKVFNRTEWISVLAEPNPIRFGKSSKMNSSHGGVEDMVATTGLVDWSTCTDTG